MAERDAIPRHVGIIVDGNRRWAKQHGLPAYEGHLAGHARLVEILPTLFKAGVEYVSLYVFSTENWKRSEDEVGRLMGLVTTMVTDDIKVFHEHQIKIRVLGTRDNLSSKVIESIEKAERDTAGYAKGTVAFCFNYGGQQELVDAYKKLIQSGVSADQVTPELIEKNLYAPDIPPIDIIVRTSGEHRLSNFMLWRAAYSELLFVDTLWPDMTKQDMSAILKTYARRHRRFGG